MSLEIMYHNTGPTTAALAATGTPEDDECPKHGSRIGLAHAKVAKPRIKTNHHPANWKYELMFPINRSVHRGPTEVVSH